MLQWKTCKYLSIINYHFIISMIHLFSNYGFLDLSSSTKKQKTNSSYFFFFVILLFLFFCLPSDAILQIQAATCKYVLKMQKPP